MLIHFNGGLDMRDADIPIFPLVLPAEPGKFRIIRKIQVDMLIKTSILK